MSKLHIKQNLREIETSCERVGPVKSVSYVRDFSFTIDQTIRGGGTNQAPTPMEYILGSFNGCVLVIVERIANEIGFHFTHLKAKSVGTIDPRGVQGIDQVSPHFKQVINTIWFETNEPAEKLAELKALVEKRCPALNLFYDADIDVELNWLLVGDVK